MLSLQGASPAVASPVPSLPPSRSGCGGNKDASSLEPLAPGDTWAGQNVRPGLRPPPPVPVPLYQRRSEALRRRAAVSRPQPEPEGGAGPSFNLAPPTRAGRRAPWARPGRFRRQKAGARSTTSSRCRRRPLGPACSVENPEPNMAARARLASPWCFLSRG